MKRLISRAMRLLKRTGTSGMFPTFTAVRILPTIPLLFCLSSSAFSQDSVNLFNPASGFNKNRFYIAAGAQAVGYGGSLALLSKAWYDGYDQTPLHSFDDSREWLQMDKAGHVVTSWYLGRMNIDMLLWSGMEKKKAVWHGAATGFFYLTGIEMLDGYSDGWGFSWSDMGANAIGTGLIITQKLLNGKSGISLFKRGLGGISIKFSFHQTVFPAYRPELLGDTVLVRQILKDYNGQTYWMSFNISSFMKHETKFPKWLNVAVGYGGERMITGRKDEFVTLEDGSTLWMERHRQYYLSLDIDLSRIKTKSHFIKALAETFCFIKIPAPALELNKYGMKFYPFYY